jgi:signal transduction histidine kinase
MADSGSTLAFIDSMPIPIWVIDAEHRIRFQNRAQREAFGALPQGSQCFSSVFGQETPCPGCGRPESAPGGTVRRAGWQPTGHDRCYDVVCVGFPVGGQSGRLAVLLDVTERARSEAQLRQTQKLESLGGVAAGIAHDFNNVLAGIIGYAQLGEQRAASSTDLADPFRQIRQIAERGAELTRKILAFGRRQPLRIAPVDLNRIAHDLKPMLDPLAGTTVTVNYELQDHLWAVMGDRGPIEQVLFNLCVNAVEAMPGGGVLTVATRNLENPEVSRLLPASVHPRGVALTVTDTGTGMPPEVASRAFEPFFTTKGRGRGTGLGLSVTYGIVKQHGGTIAIDTVLGRGTAVTVNLPATSATPSKCVPIVKPVAPPVTARRGRALVVEDERAIRDLVAELMRTLGFEVEVAGGGEEALEAIRIADGRFDLMVTDIAMPGMNGWDLAGRVTKARPGFRVLFMSGCAEATLERYGIGSDARILRKPFVLDDLSRAVNDALKPGA